MTNKRTYIPVVVVKTNEVFVGVSVESCQTEGVQF